MRLLITTQALDSRDSDLGFFVRWVEEFAKHCETVVVICLREGEHSLPRNVKVCSLKKEKGSSRFIRIRLFYKYVFTEKGEYDAVFVHMNPEYVVLAGWLWRLWHKKVGLWYVHKSVTLKLRVAALFATIIFTASKDSFRLRSRKVKVVGHGIDTDFFSPDPLVTRGDWWLSVGRLSPSKRHDIVIREAASADKELRVAGEGSERATLEALAHELGAKVHFLGGLSQLQLRDEYRRAALLVHTSETGSVDKVVLEALATGLPIRTNNLELKSLEGATPAHIREHYSLSTLIPRILSMLS